MRSESSHRRIPHLRCGGNRHSMLWLLSERMLRFLQGMLVCHMLVCMVMVMVMVMLMVMVKVMVNGELWQSSRMYGLVWEVMPHHGDPNGVVEEVMGLELVAVVGAKRGEWQGHETWGWRHRKCARRCIPRPTRHQPHRGLPALCVLELSEIIL